MACRRRVVSLHSKLGSAYVYQANKVVRTTSTLHFKRTLNYSAIIRNERNHIFSSTYKYSPLISTVHINLSSHNLVSSSHYSQTSRTDVDKIITQIKSDVPEARKLGQQLLTNQSLRQQLQPEDYIAIMQAFGKHKSFNEIYEIFLSLPEAGLEPKLEYYLEVIKSARLYTQFAIVKHLAREVYKSQLPVTPEYYAALMGYYLNINKPLESLRAHTNSYFCGVDKDSRIWNLLLATYGRINRPDLIQEKLLILKQEGIPLDSKLYNTIIAAMVECQQFDTANKYIEEMVNAGFPLTEDTYNTMINIAGKAGTPEKGLRVISEMKKKGIPPTLTIYNTLMRNYKERGLLAEMEDLVKRMSDENHVSTKKIYGMLLGEYLKHDKHVEADQVLRKAINNKCVCSFHFNLMLRYWALQVDIPKVESLFQELRSIPYIKADIISYNWTLRAYVSSGSAEKGFQLYEEMKQNGVVADNRTFRMLQELTDKQLGEVKESLVS